MEALDWYETQILCPCGCGLPRDVAHDKNGPAMKVTTVKCQARRALTIAQRDRQQQALPMKDRKKGWRPGVGEADDGLLWSVAPVDHQETLEEPVDA